jgi:hypothetical protein
LERATGGEQQLLISEPLFKKIQKNGQNMDFGVRLKPENHYK